MPKKNIILLMLIVAITATIILGFRPTQRTSDPVGEKFRDLSAAMETIERNYYRDVDSHKLLCDAVGGMVENLDEFSTYLPPAKAAIIADRLRGLGRGVGLSCNVEDGKFLVRRVLGGSPAYDAGIIPGDQIVAIGDVDVATMSARQLAEAMEVPEGQRLSLLVLRRDRTFLTVTLKSQSFSVESVGGFYRDGAGRWMWMVNSPRRIGYIAITEFVNTTVEEFNSALRQMDNPDALIIDLRGNPGGLLPPAVELADKFISSGPIVTEVGREGVINRINAHSEGTMNKIPLVLLVDGRTASAAEIVAGAMQANFRAVVVGTRTRGKGCVQTPFDLPGDLGKMNITTSQFLIGDDKPISRVPGSDVWGIEPELEFPMPSNVATQIDDCRAALRSPPPAKGSIASTVPSTMPANLRSIVVTTAPADDRLQRARELQRIDSQLAVAIELLSTPGRVEEMLAKLQAKSLAATKPASSATSTQR